MTKTRELELLDQTINKFGPDSYLGPWLSESRASIAGDINLDLPVDAMLPGPAYREGLRIRAEALAEADRIRREATEQANAMLVRARDEVERIRAEARRVLQRAAATL